MLQEMYPAAHSPASDDISLIEFSRALLKDWRIVAATVSVAAVCSVSLALLLTPMFTAQATVVESNRGAAASPTSAVLGQLGGLASLAGVDLSSLQGSSTNSRAVLKSRSIVEEFIEQNNLLPVLFSEKWDSKSGSWRTPPEESPNLWHGVKFFREEVLRIEEDLTEGLIHIRIEWTDPQTAALWANGLVTLANKLVRERDLAEAKRNIAYLNEEISRTNVVELHRVLYSLIQAEMQTVMLANSRAEYAFTVIDPAVPPELKSFPNRALIAIGGTVLGGFISLIVVLIRTIIRKQAHPKMPIAAI